ncbi:MAG: peptidylprolyl isomerase [Bacteroidetes bacterium]|nr:peptidylprolyl isomerase [Bacteroidota bacterium]
MKISCFCTLVAVLLTASNVFAQEVIVAQIDGELLSLQELDAQYAEALGSPSTSSIDSLEDFTDFFNRYVNYRVKVKEARNAGYFENPELQSEISEYRISFAQPYLMDNSVVKPMIDTLVNRSYEFVHASHIMTRIESNSSTPDDTLDSWTKIVALKDSLDAGIPFGDLAERQSEDPSASSPNSIRGYRGDLGMFKGGEMILPFENAAYSTPIGNTSGIVRSAFGYHILKVHDRQARQPDRLASHIMIRFAGNTPEDSLQAFAKIDSLELLIEQGMPFEEVAMEYSEDPGSAPSGGSLGAFIENHSPNIDRTFHDALYSLDSVGQISKVIETPFGLHLIKFDDVAELPTYDDEYVRMSRLLQSLPRLKSAENDLQQSLRELYTISVDTLELSRLIENIPTDSMKAHLSELHSDNSTPLISLQDSVYTVGHFANFMSEQVTVSNNNKIPIDFILFYANEFLNDKIIYYHSFELEQSDPEFREILQKFTEGLAIFAIMEDSVWNASSEDSLALVNFFETNPDQYVWPDRYSLIEISGSPDSLLTEAIQLLETTGMVELQNKINSDSTWNLRVDSILVGFSTNSIYDQATELSSSEHTEILSDRSRRLFLYMVGIEPARNKTFEEARSEVISYRQAIIEEEFHQRLRSKYNVVTFPERLELAFQ